MDDLISRQAAIDALGKPPEFKISLRKSYEEGRNDQWFDDVSALSRVPSAETERKKPDHGYMWICPECGLEVHSDFVRCVRCGWDRPSADLTCDGCATPKTICGICMRNYPNITDHYCTGEAWTEGKG